MTATATLTVHKPSAIDAATAFMTPRRKSPRPGVPQHPADAERVDFDFAGTKLPGWISGEGPTVLLVHGWEGSHADMAPVAAALNAVGMRTVSFDHPAHGEAPGKTAHIPMLVDAILAVVEQLGPIEAVVAHSVGGAATAIALSRHAFAKRAVLFAPPANYQDFALATGMAFGLDDAGLEEMQALIIEAGIDLPSIDTPATARGLGHVPTLILHSRDDQVVRIEDGRKIGAVWPGVRFVELEDLGHVRILSADEPLARMAEFLRPGSWLGTVPAGDEFPLLHTA